jgi:spore coat protein CotF
MTKEEFVQHYMIARRSNSNPNVNFSDKDGTENAIEYAIWIYNHIEEKVLWPNGKPDLSKATVK